MRRVTLRALTLSIILTLVAGTLLTSTAGTANAAAASTIAVSQTSVIGGESVLVSGALGTRGVRPVKLQRRSGTTWTVVQRGKSTKRGRYGFSIQPSGGPGTTNDYRVVAPRVTINGRRLVGVRTAARTVTVVGQASALNGAGTATVGKSFAMTAALAPVRAGRTTILQRLSGGVWTEVQRGVQSETGTTSFAVTLSQVGTHSLRAVAAPSAGAPAAESAPVAVKVLPSVMQRVSESSAGAEANDVSYSQGIDASGRYAVFVSDATNLVPNDTNGMRDAFVRDLETQAVERVSVSSTGVESNGFTEAAAISANGRYVAFSAGASNLVAGSGSAGNVFVHDRLSGTTELISVATAGSANNNSYHPSISADGSKVTFASLASNLVAGDTNAKGDVFIRNRTTGTTTRVSVDSDGGQSDGASTFPKISENGDYVAYTSVATNLVPGDSEGKQDVFLWSEGSLSVQRVSELGNTGVGGNGTSGGAVPSADGRYVLFSSGANNLAADTNPGDDVFRWDRVTHETVVVSLTPAGTQATFADAGAAGISADGQTVAFTAIGFPVAPGETIQTADVFVRSLSTGSTRRISESPTGTNGNGTSPFATMSSNATMVVFSSDATNLVPSDTNGVRDVFARDLTR